MSQNPTNAADILEQESNQRVRDAKQEILRERREAQEAKRAKSQKQAQDKARQTRLSESLKKPEDAAGNPFVEERRQRREQSSANSTYFDEPMPMTGPTRITAYQARRRRMREDGIRKAFDNVTPEEVQDAIASISRGGGDIVTGKSTRDTYILAAEFMNNGFRGTIGGANLDPMTASAAARFIGGVHRQTTSLVQPQIAFHEAIAVMFGVMGWAEGAEAMRVEADRIERQWGRTTLGAAEQQGGTAAFLGNVTGQAIPQIALMFGTGGGSVAIRSAAALAAKNAALAKGIHAVSQKGMQAAYLGWMATQSAGGGVREARHLAEMHGITIDEGDLLLIGAGYALWELTAEKMGLDLIGGVSNRAAMRLGEAFLAGESRATARLILQTASVTVSASAIEGLEENVTNWGQNRIASQGFLGSVAVDPRRGDFEGWWEATMGGMWGGGIMGPASLFSIRNVRDMTGAAKSATGQGRPTGPLSEEEKAQAQAAVVSLVGDVPMTENERGEPIVDARARGGRVHPEIGAPRLNTPQGRLDAARRRPENAHLLPSLPGRDLTDAEARRFGIDPSLGPSRLVGFGVGRDIHGNEILQAAITQARSDGGHATVIQSIDQQMAELIGRAIGSPNQVIQAAEQEDDEGYELPDPLSSMTSEQREHSIGWLMESVVSGRDPDTGEQLTAEELVRRGAVLTNIEAQANNAEQETDHGQDSTEERTDGTVVDESESDDGGAAVDAPEGDAVRDGEPDGGEGDRGGAAGESAEPAAGPAPVDASRVDPENEGPIDGRPDLVLGATVNVGEGGVTGTVTGFRGGDLVEVETSLGITNNEMQQDLVVTNIPSNQEIAAKRAAEDARPSVSQSQQQVAASQRISSEEQQAAVVNHAVEKVRGQARSHRNFDATHIPFSSLPRFLQTLVAQMKLRLGLEVIFFNQEPSGFEGDTHAIHGMTVPGGGATILINMNQQTGDIYQAIIAHELTHYLQSTRSWQKFVRWLRSYDNGQALYNAAHQYAVSIGVDITTIEQMEEFLQNESNLQESVALFVQAHSLTPGFWQALSMEQPSLAQRIKIRMKRILQVIGSLFDSDSKGWMTPHQALTALAEDAVMGSAALNERKALESEIEQLESEVQFAQSRLPPKGKPRTKLRHPPGGGQKKMVYGFFEDLVVPGDISFEGVDWVAGAETVQPARNAEADDAGKDKTAALKKELDNLDRLVEEHPNPAQDETSWNKFVTDVYRADRVPPAPFQLVALTNDLGMAREMMRSVSVGQSEAAARGLELAQRVGDAFRDGTATAKHSMMVVFWAINSRRQSPFGQETAALQAFEDPEFGEILEDLFRGEYSEARYKKWVARVFEELTPARQTTNNINSFGIGSDKGAGFLNIMAMKSPDGKFWWEVFHDIMSDYSVSGPESRRRLLTQLPGGMGIQNKLFSFMLLVTGRTDVMILDRIQIRHMWDDGRFFGRKGLYEEMAAGFDGLQGIALYEAIERSITNKARGRRRGLLDAIYDGIGRPDDATLANFHWETWNLFGLQEATHGSMEALYGDIIGDKELAANASSTETRMNAPEYGAVFSTIPGISPTAAPEGRRHIITWSAPTGAGGGSWEFTPADFRLFASAVRSQEFGIFPRIWYEIMAAKAKAGGVISATVINVDLRPEIADIGRIPWYHLEGINLGKLEEAARRFGRKTTGPAVAIQGPDDAGPIAAPNRTSAHAGAAGRTHPQRRPGRKASPPTGGHLQRRRWIHLSSADTTPTNIIPALARNSRRALSVRRKIDSGEVTITAASINVFTLGRQFTVTTLTGVQDIMVLADDFDILTVDHKDFTDVQRYAIEKFGDTTGDNLIRAAMDLGFEGYVETSDAVDYKERISVLWKKVSADQILDVIPGVSAKGTAGVELRKQLKKIRGQALDPNQQGPEIQFAQSVADAMDIDRGAQVVEWSTAIAKIVRDQDVQFSQTESSKATAEVQEALLTKRSIIVNPFTGNLFAAVGDTGGGIQLELTPSINRSGQRVVTIWNIFTTETARRQGGARSLINLVVKEAHSRNIGVELGIIAPFGEPKAMGQRQLEKFYRSLGFRPQGITKKFTFDPPGFGDAQFSQSSQFNYFDENAKHPLTTDAVIADAREPMPKDLPKGTLLEHIRRDFPKGTKFAMSVQLPVGPQQEGLVKGNRKEVGEIIAAVPGSGAFVGTGMFVDAEAGGGVPGVLEDIAATRDILATEFDVKPELGEGQTRLVQFAQDGFRISQSAIDALERSKGVIKVDSGLTLSDGRKIQVTTYQNSPAVAIGTLKAANNELSKLVPFPPELMRMNDGRETTNRQDFPHPRTGKMMPGTLTVQTMTQDKDRQRAVSELVFEAWLSLEKGGTPAEANVHIEAAIELARKKDRFRGKEGQVTIDAMLDILRPLRGKVQFAQDSTIINAAIRQVGLTVNVEDAAFVLPDGSFLAQAGRSSNMTPMLKNLGFDWTRKATSIDSEAASEERKRAAVVSAIDWRMRKKNFQNTQPGEGRVYALNDIVISIERMYNASINILGFDSERAKKIRRGLSELNTNNRGLLIRLGDSALAEVEDLGDFEDGVLIELRSQPQTIDSERFMQRAFMRATGAIRINQAFAVQRTAEVKSEQKIRVDIATVPTNKQMQTLRLLRQQKRANLVIWVIIIEDGRFVGDSVVPMADQAKELLTINKGFDADWEAKMQLAVDLLPYALPRGFDQDAFGGTEVQFSQTNIDVEKEFGHTFSPFAAGFIDTDGNMVDLSEKRGPPTRTLDHRSVSQHMGYEYGTPGLNDFLEDSGMIRFDMNTSSHSISASWVGTITARQRATLAEIDTAYQTGGVFIDVLSRDVSAEGQVASFDRFGTESERTISTFSDLRSAFDFARTQDTDVQFSQGDRSHRGLSTKGLKRRFGSTDIDKIDWQGLNLPFKIPDVTFMLTDGTALHRHNATEAMGRGLGRLIEHADISTAAGYPTIGSFMRGTGAIRILGTQKSAVVEMRTVPNQAQIAGLRRMASLVDAIWIEVVESNGTSRSFSHGMTQMFRELSPEQAMRQAIFFVEQMEVEGDEVQFSQSERIASLVTAYSVIDAAGVTAVDAAIILPSGKILAVPYHGHAADTAGYEGHTDKMMKELHIIRTGNRFIELYHNPTTEQKIAIREIALEHEVVMYGFYGEVHGPTGEIIFSHTEQDPKKYKVIAAKIIAVAEEAYEDADEVQFSQSPGDRMDKFREYETRLTRRYGTVGVGLEDLEKDATYITWSRNEILGGRREGETAEQAHLRIAQEQGFQSTEQFQIATGMTTIESGYDELSLEVLGFYVTGDPKLKVADRRGVRLVFASHPGFFFQSTILQDLLKTHGVLHLGVVSSAAEAYIQRLMRTWGMSSSFAFTRDDLVQKTFKTEEGAEAIASRLEMFEAGLTSDRNTLKSPGMLGRDVAGGDDVLFSQSQGELFDAIPSDRGGSGPAGPPESVISRLGRLPAPRLPVRRGSVWERRTRLPLSRGGIGPRLGSVLSHRAVEEDWPQDIERRVDAVIGALPWQVRAVMEKTPPAFSYKKRADMTADEMETFRANGAITIGGRVMMFAEPIDDTPENREASVSNKFIQHELVHQYYDDIMRTPKSRKVVNENQKKLTSEGRVWLDIIAMAEIDGPPPPTGFLGQAIMRLLGDQRDYFITVRGQRVKATKGTKQVIIQVRQILHGALVNPPKNAGERNLARDMLTDLFDRIVRQIRPMDDFLMQVQNQPRAEQLDGVRMVLAIADIYGLKMKFGFNMEEPAAYQAMDDPEFAAKLFEPLAVSKSAIRRVPKGKELVIVAKNYDVGRMYGVYLRPIGNTGTKGVTPYDGRVFDSDLEAQVYALNIEDESETIRADGVQFSQSSNLDTGEPDKPTGPIEVRTVNLSIAAATAARRRREVEGETLEDIQAGGGDTPRQQSLEQRVDAAVETALEGATVEVRAQRAIIAKNARTLIRRSGTSDEKFELESAKLMGMATRKADAMAGTVKQQIRNATDSKARHGRKVFSEREALGIRLRGEQKAAAAAARAERISGQEEARAKMRAMRERGRADKNTIVGMQDALHLIAREHLPHDMIGEATTAIRRIATAADPLSALSEGIERINTLLKRYNRREAQGRLRATLKSLTKIKLGPGYRQAVERITKDIGLKKLSGDTREQLETIAAGLEAVPEAAERVTQHMKDELKRLAQVPVADMIEEEADLLHNAIQVFLKLNELHMGIIRHGKVMARDEVAAVVVGEIIKARRPAEPSERTGDPAPVRKGPGGIIGIAALPFTAEGNFNPDRYAEWLTTEGSRTWQLLYEDLDIGYSEWLRGHQASQDVMYGALEAAGIKLGSARLASWSRSLAGSIGRTRAMFSKVGVGNVKRDETKAEIVEDERDGEGGLLLANGQRLLVTRAERMYIVATLMDQENFDLVVLGNTLLDVRGENAYDITFEDWEMIRDSMSSEETTVLEALMNHINGPIKVALRAWSVQHLGYDKTKSGTYFPRHRKREGREITTVFASQYLERVMEGMSLIQERTEDKKLPIQVRDIFDEYNNISWGTYALSEMGPALLAARQLLNTEAVTQAIKRTVGPQGLAYYNRLFDEIAKMAVGGQSFDGSVASVVKTTINNLTKGLLASNPQVMAYQVVSAVVASTEINPLYVIAAAPHLANLGLDKEIAKWSPQLRQRLEGGAMGIINEGAAAGRNQLENKSLGDRLMGGIAMFDQMAMRIIWKAATFEIDHQKAELQGDARMREIAFRAERIVKRTQPMWDVLHSTGIGLEARRNPLVKAISMFRSQRAQNVGMIYMAALRAYRNPKTLPLQAGKIATVVIAQSMLIAGIKAMFDAFRAPDDDDDPEVKAAERMMRFWTNSIDTAVGNIYLGHYLGNLMNRAIFPEVSRFDPDISPITGNVEQLTRSALTIVSRMRSGDARTWETLLELEKGSETALAFLGVPFVWPMRTVRRKWLEPLIDEQETTGRRKPTKKHRVTL